MEPKRAWLVLASGIVPKKGETGMKLTSLMLAAVMCVTSVSVAAPAEARPRHGWNNGHHGWNHGRHRVCRTVWRHHHRQRVCHWR